MGKQLLVQWTTSYFLSYQDCHHREAHQVAVHGAANHALNQNVAIKYAREIKRTKSPQNTWLNIHILREHNITTIGIEELNCGSEQHDKSNEQETTNLLEQLFENREQEEDDSSGHAARGSDEVGELEPQRQYNHNNDVPDVLLVHTGKF